MLFDLRARGRRRTVQVVYLGLAILFGLGFVVLGIGVGGGGGGSPIEAIFGNKEGSATSSYAKQVAAARSRTVKHPQEAAAWAALAEAQLHEAGSPEYYEEARQQFTRQGKLLLAKVAGSWDRYIALNPSKPNVTVAQDMLRVFGPEGLNQPTAAVEVLQLVIAAKPPSAALYGQLAAFSYQAKNTREGDLASQKTISLTPSAQRPKVEAELKRIKSNPTGNPANEPSPTTPAGTATGAGGTTTVPVPVPTTKKK